MFEVVDDCDMDDEAPGGRSESVMTGVLLPKR